jgi:hypothetical protein
MMWLCVVGWSFDRLRMTERGKRIAVGQSVWFGFAPFGWSFGLAQDDGRGRNPFSCWTAFVFLYNLSMTLFTPSFILSMTVPFFDLTGSAPMRTMKGSATFQASRSSIGL